MKLSERWAFDAADAELVQDLLSSLRGVRVLARDLEGESYVLQRAGDLSIHCAKDAVLQREGRGCVRAIDAIALGMRRRRDRLPGAEPYLRAVAAARCLELYFVLRMIRAIPRSRLTRVRFFSGALARYEGSCAKYGRSFTRELLRRAADPLSAYRALVQTTAKAYETLYKTLHGASPTRVRDFFVREPLAIFVERFPLALDLHWAFSHRDRRRPRRLSLGGELPPATSLAELVRS